MRFGLKGIFSVTLLCAALFGVCFAVPDEFGALVLALLTIAAPSVVVSMVVYGRGPWRAFAVGAASGCWLTALVLLTTVYLGIAYAALWTSGELESLNEQPLLGMNVLALMKWVWMLHFGILATLGLLSVLVRRLFAPAEAQAAERARRKLRLEESVEGPFAFRDAEATPGVRRTAAAVER